MRLIDLDKTKEMVREHFPSLLIEMAVTRFLEGQPTVDTAPVVRCKDCRHCEIVDETQRYFCRRPLGSIGYIPVKPDDYCSYGEARSDAK